MLPIVLRGIERSFLVFVIQCAIPVGREFFPGNGVFFSCDSLSTLNEQKIKSDYNFVVIVGSLGQDPEVFCLGSKPPFAKVLIATNNLGNKEDRKFSKVEWHCVIFNRKLTEFAERHLHKGDKILVTGELISRKWQIKMVSDGFLRQIKELSFVTPKSEPGKKVCYCRYRCMWRKRNIISFI